MAVHFGAFMSRYKVRKKELFELNNNMSLVLSYDVYIKFKLIQINISCSFKIKEASSMIAKLEFI